MGAVEIISKRLVMQWVYPVGSVYVNISDSTNPGTLLGFGTWERVGSGKVLVDASSSYAAGTAYTPTHDHGGYDGAVTLTANQSGLRSHNHMQRVAANTGGTTSRRCDWTTDAKSNIFDQDSVYTANTGGWNASESHKHSITAVSVMPPCVGVYMWKRTA